MRLSPRPLWHHTRELARTRHCARTAFATTTRLVQGGSGVTPPSSLALWRLAVGRIVDEGQDDVDVMQSLLPTAFGGSAKAATAAWHGDKLLNAAIAKELEVQAPHCDVGQLTKWASKAASNQVMATHISELLPSKLMQLLPTAAQERQVCESRTNPTQYTRAPSNASKRIYAIKPSSKTINYFHPDLFPSPFQATQT